MDMNAELQKLLDIEAIRRMLIRFVQLGDRSEHDAWIDECLHPDVTWAVRSIDDDDHVSSGITTIEGREAVRDIVKNRGFRGVPRGRWDGSHIVTTPVVDVDGDQATSVTDAVWLWHVPADEPTGQIIMGALQYDIPDYRIISVVRWVDELVRTPDGWQIRVHKPSRLGGAAT